MTQHPYNWESGQPFPPSEIFDPPREVKGLWLGICVFCGGSLGGPYQEDLFHEECYDKAETGYFEAVKTAVTPRRSVTLEIDVWGCAGVWRPDFPVQWLAIGVPEPYEFLGEGPQVHLWQAFQLMNAQLGKLRATYQRLPAVIIRIPYARPE